MRFVKILFVLAALIGSTPLSHAMRFSIDRDVTSTNGCKFHLHGWINVNWSGDVDHYDLIVSGPCGNFRFKAISVNPGTGMPTGDDESIGSFASHVYRLENDEEVTDYPFTNEEVMNEAAQGAGQ